MSPRMEPDFDWTDVQATTPVYPKGDYQITVVDIRGSAWPKTDDSGNATGVITKVVRFRNKMVGVYNSKGKLSTELDGKPIGGEAVEDLNLWVHSDGGRKMAKQSMMAILGYSPRDGQEEKKFNELLKKQKADLSTRLEEGEDGSLSLVLGDGWKALFVGKNFRASLEEETREIPGRDPILQQNYQSISPVNT